MNKRIKAEDRLGEKAFVIPFCLLIIQVTAKAYRCDEGERRGDVNMSKKLARKDGKERLDIIHHCILLLLEYYNVWVSGHMTQIVIAVGKL